MFKGTISYEINWPQFWQIKKIRLLYCTHKKCNYSIKIQIPNTDSDAQADLNKSLNDHLQMHILFDESGLPYEVSGYEQSLITRNPISIKN